MKCPKCGSKSCTPILYGIPTGMKNSERRAANKEVLYGGCFVLEDSPKYRCQQCGKYIGTKPFLVTKHSGIEQKIEDYRDIVTSINYTEGGFFNGYLQLTIKKRKTISAEVLSPYTMKKRYTLTEKEWCKLLDSLYCKMYLHEWKKQYSDPNICIMDGEDWQLNIHLKGGRIRNYGGNQTLYPPYWKELHKLVNPFFERMLLDDKFDLW